VNSFVKKLTPEKLEELFPKDKTDRFFEALLGDCSEGAYDIELAFKEMRDNTLEFEFLLKQRPGKCLACNLTYGLPKVFQKHPTIDISGLIESIQEILPEINITGWELGYTREVSKNLHVIPLTIYFFKKDL
jgi:hypothetical protein